jgi:lysophospholipase L1-like esterase
MKKLLLTAMLCLAATATASAAEISINDGETLYFDFGSTPESGYICVDAMKKYSKDAGYGFNHVSDVYVENTVSSGSGILSDAVKFNKTGTKSDATFNVDLPEGMYKIKVYAGDITRISIAAEGQYAIMNMTGNNAVSEVEIPVTDGQLNLLATEGKEGTDFSLSALEITKIPSDEPRKTRIFIGGDSITTTYYPLEVSAPLEVGYQGGWGQMLQNYLPDNFYVHNFATGGQYAKGFLESGQFEAIENLMQAGDYFIVGFGINDQNYSNEDEFEAAMTEMVERTKAKGGIPIIITTEGRLFDFNSDGIFYKPDRWYKNTAKKIAADEGIHYIDLHDISSAYFTAIGQEDTTKLYWVNWSGDQDTLHANREGAGQMARLVAEDLIRQEFAEFISDKLYIYGASSDITLKASGIYDVNHLDLQNLKPSSQNISLVINSYDENGILTGCRLATYEIPPFDVLNPAVRTELTLDGVDENSRVYIFKNNEFTCMNSNQMYGYSVPYETAKKLFTDYVVPTEAPTEAPDEAAN